MKKKHKHKWEDDGVSITKTTYRGAATRYSVVCKVCACGEMRSVHKKITEEELLANEKARGKIWTQTQL